MSDPNISDRLFSINSLPSDTAFLLDLRAAINAKIGDNSVNIHKELVENLEVARRVRDRLCGIVRDEQGAVEETDFGYGYGPEEGKSYDDEPKDASKVSAIRAFNDIINNLVKLQDVALSQKGSAALQACIIDVLGECDPKLQMQVVAKFRQRIEEMEQAKGR